MSLKIGIVGLPNVGKSTLFNALLGTNQAAASNFPFCTIEPNTGIVPVPDPRLSTLAEIEKSAKVVPPTVEFVDIAGLVKGASEGQGLGNKFLAHIRETDAIIQVVRQFRDDNIIHVSGNIEPKNDIEIINTELILADLEMVEKHLQRESKAAKTDPKLKPKVEFLEDLQKHLATETPARSYTTTDEQKIWLKEFQLLTAKPVMYVANLDEDQLKNPDALKSILDLVAPEGATVLGVNAKIEAELAQLPESERKEYLDELGLDEPSLNKIIRAGYTLLGLATYFTAGPQEARGWTIKEGFKAPQAAGVIHTDFERGFIRAEVVTFEDFVAHTGWVGARTVGKVRSEGKDYVVKDGDVVLFRFNV